MSDSHDHAPAPADPHAPADSHAAAAHGHHEMHVKLYVGIGAALVVLTGFTVFLSYVNFDKWMPGKNMNMIVGMFVATFKVCLVGAIFMHLKGEKPTVWRFLYFTAFFVLGLFLLTWFALDDPIFGTSHNHH